MIFGRQPAFWIGLIGSLLVAAFQTFAEHGLISSDTSTSLINLVGALLPLITGAVIHFFVSPAEHPGL